VSPLIGQRPHFAFSEKKEKGKGGWPSEISLADVWEWVSHLGQKVYQEGRKMSWMHWAMLGSLPLLYWLGRKDEVEEYAINYLEDELSRNSSEFNELHVKIYVTESQSSYKVFFEKDNKRYFVNFGSNADRLQKILRQKHKGIKVVYEYVSNYEIKLGLPTVLANLISVLFIAAFFTRSSSLSSGTRNSSNSNIYQQLLGEKKVFDVIQKTNVRFADVAGLD
jgi:ATP-dependent Zn protease